MQYEIQIVNRYAGIKRSGDHKLFQVLQLLKHGIVCDPLGILKKQHTQIISLCDRA